MQAPTAIVERLVSNRQAQTLGDLFSDLGILAVEHNEELLAAITADPVVIAHTAVQPGGDGTQAAVASALV